MEATGDVETAWELEQELLALAARHPAELQTARIFRDTADRRMDILRRYSAGEWPPEIVLGCYYSRTRDGNCTSGSRARVKRLLLREAQSYYSESINILLENEQFRSEELPALLMELVHSSYMYSTPSLGERSLHFLLAFQVTNDEPWMTRIETLIQIADWRLMYANGRNETDEAIDRYEEVFALLEERGADRASIERLFSPRTPVVIPAFVPNPLLSPRTGEGTGYIDVAFEVSKYGEARKLRVLGATSGATRSDERELTALILRSRFRPRTTNGEFTDSERVVLRYYLSD